MEFEKGFCDFLEYRICDLLEKSKDEQTKGFWCDGVIFEIMLEDTALFTAFTGKSGQEKYKLFLHLGEKSLSLISDRRDIQSCIPAESRKDTFTVDTEKKQIHIFAS